MAVKFLSDIEIAQKNKMVHINEIATKLNIDLDDLELYGKSKAKLPLSIIDEKKIAKNNLVLVTALT
ncbi:MAG: formate--tetrahydrofolate ligase, partial [Vicingaceae bacterium]